MAGLNIADYLLQALERHGVRHIFGNPGSTELPLIDALASAEDLHYVLALQEATAVGIADGYAQATGRPPKASIRAVHASVHFSQCGT